MLRKLVTYCIIIGISAAIGILAAELYFSARSSRAAIPFYNRLYPYVMFRPYESTDYVSNETFAMSHYKSRVFHYTNEDGFRVTAPGYKLPRQKPRQQFRVAVLGSSAIQTGSTFETTLPGSLKRWLASRYPGRDIEVINAGIISCVSRQSIVHLLLTVVDYQPDVVILYDGANDVGLPLTYEVRANFPYNFQSMENAWDQYRSERQESLLSLVLSRSRVYTIVRAALSKTKQAPKAGPVERPDTPYHLTVMPAGAVIADHKYVADHIAGYLSNWVKLIELSEAYHFQPVLVLQPTGELQAEYAIPQNQKNQHLSYQAAVDWNKAMIAMFSEASRQVAQLRGRYPQAVFLDLSDFLKPAEKYFWDGVHVYDEANMVLAAKIGTEIIPYVDRSQAAGAPSRLAPQPNRSSPHRQ